MPNLNVYQVFLIIVAVLSAVAGSAAQLTDMFGAGTAHTIVTAATFSNTIITAIMTPLVGNASMLKNVTALVTDPNHQDIGAAMTKTVANLPGVTRVSVNTQALPALAAAAVDANQPKVGPADPGDRAALQAIAKG